MEYPVLISFTDRADETAKPGENVYWAGKSVYPRKDFEPSAERIAFLQGSKNPYGKPIIGKPKK